MSKIELTNPTGKQLGEAISAALKEAQGRASTRTLSPEDFPFPILMPKDARPAIARQINGGGVPNSYGYRADSTYADIWAATLPGGNYRVEIEISRGNARAAAYGNVAGERYFRIDTSRPYSEPERDSRFVAAAQRADEATVALVHFESITVDELERQFVAIPEIKSYRSATGAYDDVALHTDCAFVVTRMEGKSPMAATRYRWQAGRLIESGVSLRLRNAAGSLYWEHGASEEECRAEAERKIETERREEREAQERRRQSEEEQKRQRREDRKARLLARLSTQLRATMGDARDAGHCDAGIRSWCQARGIDPTGSVALSALMHDSDRRAQAVALRVARKAIAAR